MISPIDLELHKSLAERLPKGAMLIGEDWVLEGEEGMLPHVSPTTGLEQGYVPLAGKEDVDRAVDAARGALPGWRSMRVDLRRDLLFEIAAKIREHADEFATIGALESGHPRDFERSAAEYVATPADFFAYYAGWADKVEGELVTSYPDEALDYVRYEPFGVVAALLTWNGPLHNAAMKVAPALAAGNCVILKPPELGPFAPIRLAQLCLEVGLPPGVLNVVTGGPAAGEALVRHPGVDKISFTGGTMIAKRILKMAAESITPVTLELGGKSANLIFADADLDAAAELAAQASMIANSGQVCLSPSRLLVEDAVYEEVVGRVLAVMADVRIGDPLAAGTQMGPLIDERAAGRVMGIVEAARERGDGKLLLGGERLGGELQRGCFVGPTIFGDVSNASPLAQEEIFGPVLSIIRFSSEDDAVEIANNSRYGLGAYVHTNDLRRAHRIVRRLEAGYVAVNGRNPIPASAPLGGVKESGYGREGGRQGIEEFLSPKNVYIKL